MFSAKHSFMNNIYLNIGDVVVSERPASLETILGSCVSVCIWDNTIGIGGMNHIMLPKENGNKNIKPTVFAYPAVDMLIQKLQAMGCMINNLQAKIFGGGIAIKVLAQSFNVGGLNVEAAKRRLKYYDIPVVDEYTEPQNGIRLTFHTHTGSAYVKDFSECC